MAEVISDGYLKSNLDIAKGVIKDDWDMVLLVDGYEGSGKSVMAQQCGWYLDNTLDINRICFTPEEFKTAILNSAKYQCVIYDEAYTGLSSRGTMGAINKAIVSMLAEIRQKNLFIIIVMPSFFDLDKYVAVWRSRALIHCKAINFKRGHFYFWDVDRKKELYIKGKKTYSYSAVKPNFYGKFNNLYTVDEKAYKDKKAKSLSEKEKKSVKDNDNHIADEIIFNRVMAMPSLETHKQRMELLGLPESTYYLKLKKWKELNPIEDNSDDLLGNEL